MDRSFDWLRQAERDLEQAKLSLREGFYDWACFAAQQSAEKAIKALCEKYNIIIRTHQLMGLLKALNELENITDEIYQKGVTLDRFYIPTRYPNGFTSGAPMEYFFLDDAQEAINNTEAIIQYCRDKITGT